MELSTSEGYNTLHTSSSVQTIETDIKNEYPSDIIIRKTVDGNYDNPTMIMKD